MMTIETPIMIIYHPTYIKGYHLALFFLVLHYGPWPLAVDECSHWPIWPRIHSARIPLLGPSVRWPLAPLAAELIGSADSELRSLYCAKAQKCNSILDRSKVIKCRSVDKCKYMSIIIIVNNNTIFKS